MEPIRSLSRLGLAPLDRDRIGLTDRIMVWRLVSRVRFTLSECQSQAIALQGSNAVLRRRRRGVIWRWGIIRRRRIRWPARGGADDHARRNSRPYTGRGISLRLVNVDTPRRAINRATRWRVINSATRRRVINSATRRRAISGATCRRVISSAAPRWTIGGSASRAARGCATHGAVIRGGAIRSLHMAPAERIWRDKQRRHGKRHPKDMSSHFGFSCLNSIFVTPAGTWTAKPASAGCTLKFQSDISAMKRGSPGSER